MIYKVLLEIKGDNVIGLTVEYDCISLISDGLRIDDIVSFGECQLIIQI